MFRRLVGLGLSKLIEPTYSNKRYIWLTMQLRKRTRSATVKYDDDGEDVEQEPQTESPYFSRPKRSKRGTSRAKAGSRSKSRTSSLKAEKSEENSIDFDPDPVDTEWVKTLNNAEYFKWIAERTGNVEGRWNVPLSEAAFIPMPGAKLPKYFKEIYLKIRRLRPQFITPVDTMGSSSVSLTVARELGIEKGDIEPVNYRIQALVSIMLSSQTKDEVTARAMYNLTQYCMEEYDSPGITLMALLKIDETHLDQLIRMVGFHQRKASYLKRAAQMLVDNFGSDAPTTIEGLMSLPGVGPKMGYLALQKLWGKMDGICVDVHVDRFCKLFHWVSPNCKTPNDTRKELQTWLPHPLWREINSLLVGYGQVIDRPKPKLCEKCIEDKSRMVCESKQCPNSILDPEVKEMMKHMQTYKDWVNYLVNCAKVETSEGQNLVKLKKEEKEDVLETLDKGVPLIKLENSGSVALKTEAE